MKKPPGVLRCLMLLMVCDVSLRVFGYARTLRAARRLAGERSAQRSRELMQQTLHNILVATAFYPGRSKCLEQAMAGFVLLRRRGVAVDIRLGVQPYPFCAHAWLELDGAPVTESPELVATFALLPDPAL
jgi:hypothetical protein